MEVADGHTQTRSPRAGLLVLLSSYSVRGIPYYLISILGMFSQVELMEHMHVLLEPCSDQLHAQQQPVFGAVPGSTERYGVRTLGCCFVPDHWADLVLVAHGIAPRLFRKLEQEVHTYLVRSMYILTYLHT